MAANEMTCPCCGKPMREGRIYGGNRLCWRPAGGLPVLLKGAVPRGGVPLPGKFSYARGQDAPAFYCPDCGKLLMDVDR